MRERGWGVCYGLLGEGGCGIIFDLRGVNRQCPASLCTCVVLVP